MSNQHFIEVESDNEDDDLRAAIALSLQEIHGSGSSQDEPNAQHAMSTSESSTGLQLPKGKATFGKVQLDRKQMEEERLMRLNKRCRGSFDGIDTDAPAAKRQLFVPTHNGKAGPLQYPGGAVKRTWARGYTRTSEDIRIEEVLLKDELQLALLSSFQWDEAWILSKVNVTKTKLMLVAFASDEKMKESMKDNAPDNVRFCFPKMHGPGAMHSKLQVLKYASSIRLVLPTGNLVPYDWGETGVMENMIFLIDLPLLRVSDTFQSTMFSEGLIRFLEALGVDAAMIQSLYKYDFSATADLGFIYTIPGAHSGESLKQVGYAGLGHNVKSLGLASSASTEIDLICSSLGSLNSSFISAIYNACQGDDGMTEYRLRSSRPAGQKPVKVSERLRCRFRIYFPTYSTVAGSRGGKGAGGTICLQPKWWNSPEFPRELFRDCVNTRDGLLLHSKMLFVRNFPDASKRSHQADSWGYLGSANLSESAWGRIVKDRTSREPKISCRNWEAGVLIPIREAVVPKSSDMSIFSEKIPVPMLVPGPAYTSDQEPWFFQNR